MVGSKYDIALLAEFFAEWTKVFVAKAKVQSQVRSELPIVLGKSGKVMGAKITLGVAGAAGSRVGVYLIKERRVVREIEQTGKAK